MTTFLRLNRGSRPARVATAVFLGTALVAGCGSSSGSSSTSSSDAVNVLYAGSLVDLMRNQIGPAFKKATGHSVKGFSAGDKDVASQIKAKVHVGDVFMSANPTVNTPLMGKANGNLVSWYATYATSALVIGYKPDGRFAADLKSKPWYTVLTEPGFRVGFSDPKTDPKGALAVQAMKDTAAMRNLPALAKVATDTSNMFPEETLVGRLQSGQLDAGFYYASETVAAKIPSVPLTGEDMKATYTVTVLNNAPHKAASAAFVSYLLGPDGQRILKQDGFALVTPPQVTGSGVPDGLRAVLAK